MNKFLSVSVLCCVVSAFSSNLHADIAVTFSLPQIPLIDTGFTPGKIGFDFIPSANLTVDALGYYDYRGNGLLHSHEIGIFDTQMKSLVAPSAFVSSASTLDVTNNFRFQSVTPFTLNAETQYSLVSYDIGPPFDDYIFNPVGGARLDPKLRFVRDINDTSGSFGFPSSPTSFGNGWVFGPNFSFTAVPEPSCLFCVGAGFLAIAMRKRRRRLA